MPRFVHISDLHFGREQPAIIEAWFKLMLEIKPDLVIISGDLTQRATDEEYLAAQQFLKHLIWPYFIVPGNHDMSATNPLERFLSTWDKWHQYIAPSTEPSLIAPSFTVLGVNTARPAGWYFDWSRGQINQQQINVVQQGFKATPEANLRVVVAHHPFWLPKESEYRDLVERRDEALIAFHYSGVDLILSGHVHRAYTQIIQGVLIVHSGTTFSNRLTDNQANSFNIIQGDRSQLNVRFMHWSQDQFQLTEERQFQHKDGVWQQIAGETSI